MLMQKSHTKAPEIDGTSRNSEYLSVLSTLGRHFGIRYWRRKPPFSRMIGRQDLVAPTAQGEP
jgi:hypothetical protein